MSAPAPSEAPAGQPAAPAAAPAQPAPAAPAPAQQPAAAPVPGGTPGAGPALPPWLSGLQDPDLAAVPSLGRFQDVKSLAKSYTELERKIGMKGLIPPTEKSSPEERQAFWRELGMPEKAEGYGPPEGFELPKDLPIDEQFIARMQAAAHAAHLPKGAWDSFFSSYVAMQKEQYDAVVAHLGQTKQAGEAALRQEWGPAFDAKVNAAVGALQFVFGKSYPELAAMVLSDGTPLASHPGFIRAFAQLADRMGDPRSLPSVGARAAMTPAEAQREMNRIMADPNFLKAWTDASHPEHQDAVNRRRDLMEAIVGQQPQEPGSSTGLAVTGGAISRG